MRKTSNKPKSNDYEIELPANPFAKSKNIQVVEDPQRNLAVLRVYGEIDEPAEYIEEIARLNQLSQQYDIIEITLNSPGGSLNTAVDLASIINNFNYVITIGKGEVASAAFMLWTMGDIKVVTNYSMYMAHRESYGMYGKTSEHKYAADVFGSVYEELFEKCFSTILTAEESLIADRSEAWVSYKDLVSRDGIISYDEYIQPKNPYSVAEYYVLDNGKVLMFDSLTQAYRTVEIEFGNEIITDMTEYLYGIDKLTELPKPKTPKTPKKVIKSKKKSETKSTDEKEKVTKKKYKKKDA